MNELIPSALFSYRHGRGTFAVMPIQSSWDRKNWRQFEPISIPWAMIAPHDAQAKENHAGQDLKRLAERGGLSPCEALAILDDRKWERMDANEAHDELQRRVAAYGP